LLLKILLRLEFSALVHNAAHSYASFAESAVLVSRTYAEVYKKFARFTQADSYCARDQGLALAADEYQ